MSPTRWLRHLWRSVARGHALDRDLRDEVSAYVEQLEAEARDRGEDPAEARRRARLALGGISQVEEEVRSARPGAWLTQAWQDTRYAIRLLRRTPTFAVSVVLTLGLAIGVTAAMFGAVRSIVLAPLPFPDPDRLVRVVDHGGYAGEYLQFKDRARTFAPAIYAPIAPLTLTGAGDPVRLETVTASGDLFEVLGARPALGQSWQPSDSDPDAEPIVTLSDHVWRGRFGSDPGVVGRTILLDGESRRVRGVMPPTFAFPDRTVDVWIPAIIDPTDRVALWSRGGMLLGRLTTGATVAAAHAEVRQLAPTFATLFPWRMPPGYGEEARVVPLREALVGDTDTTLGAALAAVAFVLVMACLNVSLLLIGRSLARRAEMTTRAALGASRARLARQTLVECVVLVTLGGVLALVTAVAASGGLVALLPADLPRLHEVTPDGWLMTAVVMLTAMSGLAIGIAPTWRAARQDGSSVPGPRSGGRDRGSRTVTRVLVATEVALAMTLISGAGLLVRSVDRLLDVDPGFRPAGLVSATIAPPAHRYSTDPARRAFFGELLDRLEAIPHVAGAAVTDRLPFSGVQWGSVFIIEERPDPARESGDWPWADVRAVVSAGFFATLDVPIVRGRAFTPRDTAASEPVAVVSEALARQYWPGEDPVGRRVRFPGTPADRWVSIVGIAADSRWERLSEDPPGTLFLPVAQSSPATMSVIVRTSNEEAVMGLLRPLVQDLDADTPVDEISAVATRVRASAGSSQFLAVLFSGFGLVGVLLGCVGIYGITTDAVAHRRQELAVRMAIGAQGGSIVRLVVRQSLALALAGLTVGLVGTLASTRFLAGVLFGVEPTDPATLIAASAGLMALVTLACYLPARRASRLDPLGILRES